jgi:peptide deformylase
LAIRKIRTSEDPILRKKSKVVTEITPRVIDMLDDMTETMHNAASGVGLAAPQVGILKRLVVIDLGDGPIDFINPEIISSSGTQTGYEGCLSVPDMMGTVTRPNKVKVRAMNRKGEIFELEGEELMARALCHEIDHLEGILYTDHVEGELVRCEYEED